MINDTKPGRYAKMVNVFADGVRAFLMPLPGEHVTRHAADSSELREDQISLDYCQQLEILFQGKI